MDFVRKAAYLKGLFEGMNFDKTKDETKIFGVMVDLLQDIAFEIKNLKADSSENKELIYELDEDLGEIEKVVYGCKHSSSVCGCSDSCSCDGEQEDTTDSGDYNVHDEYVDAKKSPDIENEDEEEKYEVLCPHCSQIINLENASLKENEIVCPQCGKELELDFDEDDME